MRRVLLFAFGFVFAGLTAASFLAQPSQSRETRFQPMLGNDVVLHMMAIAGAGQADADPLNRNLISFEDARRVVDLAAASAAAAWCGVEWQRGNLQNLMGTESTGNRRNAEALAYIARLHTVAMEMFQRDLQATSACPERHKQEVAKFFASRWATGMAVALDSRAVESGSRQ